MNNEPEGITNFGTLNIKNRIQMGFDIIHIRVNSSVIENSFLIPS